MPNSHDATSTSEQPEPGSDTARVEQRVVNTYGGDHAEGNIDKRQGTFVRGNLVVTEELAYTVSGLPNPYLGLRAFTAAERDIFAGRERMIRVLVDRLSAADGDRLLFIVGASGSGKSSLARAGLLPGLADWLRRENREVQTRIIDHPGRMLATSLTQLLQEASDNQSSQFLILLIDQFEELFSQADPSERDLALRLLADVVTNIKLPVRIIATMRSDFLPQLVADSRFEIVEQRKVVVRAMSVADLTEAIQRPIQLRYPEKRFEPALVERLANDAATDAAYLPLLQVTLEDLWRGGDLRLGTYTGLAHAIQRRADTVYTWRDYDGLQQEQRTADEQEMIIHLFLDLVRVSLNDEQRDVRWRRSRAELTQGDPPRERLIADLATARLLRTDREVIKENGQERELETVDIVHEALLTGWSMLSEAIDAKREHLRQRVRFDVSLTEWLAHKQQDDYLLSGVRLAEAEALKQRGDGIFERSGAQGFYDRSVERRAAEQAQQLRLERRARYFFQSLTVVLICITAVALYQPIRIIWLREQARGHLSIEVPGMAVRFDPYEVSNSRYRFCVDAGVCLEPFSNNSTYFQGPSSNDLPVTGVDVLQAARFCEWLDAHLPSQAQWEQAAFAQAGRGTTAEWQLMLDTASFAEQNGQLVGSADSKSRTPEGIYNLLGNVSEWTSSLENGSVWDQQNQTIPPHLQVVGGSIKMSHPPATPDEVQLFAVTDRFDDLGFRCVYD